jgi:transmembrane sensor
MKTGGPLDWDVLRDDVADVERGIVPWDDELRQARARFLLATRNRSLQRPRKRFSVAWAAVAFAASIVLSVVAWQRFKPQAPVNFDIGIEHATGQVGALLSAVGPEALPVRFSDGTSLSMASATLARVTETNWRGATVVLEEGSLRVAVVHRDASAWHVKAGPFTVIVTGTKFDVRWSAREQALALDLQEGSVTVLGPSLGASGRRVSSGESLRVSVEEKVTDVSPPLTSAAGETAAAPARRDDATRSLPSDATGNGRGSWRQLALGGRYAEALAAAEGEGFDAACRRASAADLLLLGDTARFAGSPKLAEQALQLVRARLAGTHEAAMAAFSLGRIAYDERRNYREAARWFRTYLREEPSGGLAREAAGRLIEAESAAGDVAGARESAIGYLGKYPAGPHAGLARTVLNR